MLTKEQPVISGLSASNGLAVDRAGLVAALSEGRHAAFEPFFGSAQVGQTMGLPYDPLQVAMPRSGNGLVNSGQADLATARVFFGEIIKAALQDAGLELRALQGSRVQLYIAGYGVQPEVMQFATFVQRNDREDLLLYPGIKQLHCSTHQEEGLARALMQDFALARPPMTLSTASCSSLSALYPACKALQRGALDIAVVVSWQQVTLYNLVFMAGVNSLAQTVFQPFSAATQGVMLGAGMAAVVLESPAHLRQRKARGKLRIEGFAMAQGSGAGKAGQSFAPDFRLIAKVIEQSLQQAAVAPEDVSCVFAHGNGMRSSDQAELMAFRKVWGERGVPVVSYKGQMGYLVTASGLTDLAILEDAMSQGRLLGFSPNAQLDHHCGVYLHDSATPLQLQRGRMTKVALGIEGSIAVCTLGQVA